MMAPRRKATTALGGVFTAHPTTEEQWASARAEAERMGLIHVFLVGERADGTAAFVTVSMTSINHMMETADRAFDALPTWRDA